MKNIYLILKKGTNTTTLRLLEEAAHKYNITVYYIYTEDFDFSKKINLDETDGLYRISTDTQSCLIEKFLINNKVKSFYTNYHYAIGRVDTHVGSSLIHEKEGLSIIKTIFSLGSNTELLKQYVQELGDFPLIIKSMGGMHGVGVMKIDSFESLSSIVDYLKKKDDTFIMRKFIKHSEQARIIVVGNQVVASHANISSGDFRTNAGKESSRKREVKKYSPLVENLAVRAVNSLGYEFGGVDILFDENNNNEAVIAEVNSPCFFARTQNLTGINIAEKMIKHLMQK